MNSLHYKFYMKKVVLVELCIKYNEDLYYWLNHFTEASCKDAHDIFWWVVTVEYLIKWDTTCK